MLARVIIEVEKGNPGCVHGHQTGQRMIYEGTQVDTHGQARGTLK